MLVETRSAKIIFICLYHNHLNHYASVHILVPGEFVFVLPHTGIAILCEEIGVTIVLMSNNTKFSCIWLIWPLP